MTQHLSYSKSDHSISIFLVFQNKININIPNKLKYLVSSEFAFDFLRDCLTPIYMNLFIFFVFLKITAWRIMQAARNWFEVCLPKSSNIKQGIWDPKICDPIQHLENIIIQVNWYDQDIEWCQFPSFVTDILYRFWTKFIIYEFILHVHVEQHVLTYDLVQIINSEIDRQVWKWIFIWLSIFAIYYLQLYYIKKINSNFML